MRWRTERLGVAGRIENWSKRRNRARRKIEEKQERGEGRRC